uniref:Uncharacterized protein n=1 Tax=Pyramimonas obovata TaxID=1411642 RepID=A0A7S0MQW1_9CHLO|mmetsp:Transcript_11061/g.23045  ORF Transcript_11061/g.23045 Transcript_11061/m.23045 type:complete len:601 (+) Transcript_11061:114-1916(+)|eukprot:CAMPEP_0118932866 /NCGR_PEP_ID=MMETSP1169-20130426/10657_1 /TAXON_ID=36882 /ORGANISM="Pyramimonas obovata, Strain CCMP722" /LENGTH=600 /DNA_ID=CAMNT_0006875571 /DNA_START=72 /DNA_END=1874 /DNA_ORIENTATION=-
MLASKTAQRVGGGVHVSQKKLDQRGGALKRHAVRMPRGRDVTLRTVRTRAFDNGSKEGRVEESANDRGSASSDEEAALAIDKLVEKPGLAKAAQSQLLKLQSLLIKGNIPIAVPQLSDLKELLGGALFLPLFQWMEQYGDVYILPTGPVSSFLVISEPQAAKHVLKDYNTYRKGLVNEIAEFLFGDGFATAEGELWKVRRRAVGPSLHKGFLETMTGRVFGKSALELNRKLEVFAETGKSFDMESNFSQLTLDIIGLAVFNYDFASLNKDSPVIQAVYTALKETEQRATDLLPIWKLPDPLRLLFPRQKRADEAVQVIRATTEELIEKCKAIVAEEVDINGTCDFGEDYCDEEDPSVLRFLLASREEVTEKQLRDDLLSMLVAGHETTGSVLTWTTYLLATNRDKLEKVFEEVDRVLADKELPTYEDVRRMPYLMRCVNESMRLYPHPPVLIRRATRDDVLPGGWEVRKGQDMMISVYNIHHSPEVWADAEEFIPERFGDPSTTPIPNEQNTDYSYIPFSGGQRKCVGDQFALLEAVVSLSVLLRTYDVHLVPGQDIQMTTGATIHTLNGLFMTVTKRHTDQTRSTDEQVAGEEARPLVA